MDDELPVDDVMDEVRKAHGEVDNVDEKPELDVEEESEPDESEKESEADKSEADDDGFYIDVGEDDDDESEDAKGEDTITYIRKANRKLAKEKRELERKLAEMQRPEQADFLGDKPDLEDFDYDQEKFAEALIEWNEKKRVIEAEQAKKREADEAANQAWIEKRDAYFERRNKVRNDDYEIMDDLVTETLTELQKNILIAASDDPVSDVYKLGNRPEELKRLSGIHDQIKFIYELGKLHSTQKGKEMAKAKPAPEKRVTGSAPKSVNHEAKLAQLREEADRTGDRTKVVAYRKKHSL